ncbi:zinc finger protein 518A [Oncorhynchus tshawytscha]|uniref:C2H2-type domain-containing protein n=1 Tax=Oncorhynchus tshawytscha TaxID=74940 RepID=A0A8C8GRW9_ONCTS|nr:zinc finger protein 518A [Oncorhynchus tshawytscha]XP_024280563.1 zinc finger protein 518A [Oncorhynchus tshawytscha]
MDPARTELDVPAGGNIKVVEDDRNWNKRLRLRKAAVQPPAMQSKDKHGPKKITEDMEKSTEQTYLKKTPLKVQEGQHVTKVSGNILGFRCSECQDSTVFSPNDLLRHFQETHPGSQPIFPCDMCSFITHEFSRLKVHQLGHRDTFVSCNICNDNVQHTLLQLTTHLNMHHSLNGHYCCEKCKFSTRDVGAFLEHLYLHNIAPQAGSADQDLMRHLMAKTAQFRFSCRFCDYKSHRKYIITRHMATIHGEEKSQKNKPKMKDVGPKTVDNSSPRLKHTVTSTVRENNWMSQGCLSLPGEGFLDKYCRLSNPERALEETKQFLEKSVAAETGGQTWNEALKTVLSNVPQAITSFSNSENCMISNPGFTNTDKDLTVLMLKNKISVRPDVTTEAIGFKMVEGKKHLVLKVTPAAKQETSDTTKTSLCVTEQESEKIACQTSAGDSNANGCQSNSTIPPKTRPPSCPESFSTQNDIDTISTLKLVEYDQTQENRENQETRVGQEHQRHDAEPKDVNHCEDTVEDMKVPKLTVEKSEKKLKSFPEALCSSKTMGDKKRWRTKVVSPKTVEKKSSPALKLLLKKNPVKEMQWMSQGPLPLLGGGLLNNSHRLEHPQKTLEETQQFLKRALSMENGKKKHTKSKVVTQSSKSEGGFIPNLGHFSPRVNNLGALMVKNKILVPPNCTTESMGFKMVDGKKHLVLKVIPSDKTEASLHSVVTKEDNTLSESCTMSQNSLVVVEKSQPSSKIPPSTITKSNLEYNFENVELPNTNVSSENREGMNNGMDSHVLGGQHCPRVGLPHVSNGAKSDGNDLDQITEDKPDLEGVGTTEAQVIMVSPSPILNYLTFPQGITNWSEIPVHTPDVYSQDFPPNTTLRDGGKQEVFDRICLSPQQNKQTVRGKRQSELSTEDSLEPLSKANKPSSKVVEEKEASPAAAHHWEPGPRDVERTLKLLPLSPTQLITRPRGDQPVVVLNHPDTDIPEVTNIMETVHRYKGEVQKVLLSRKTLKAFAGMGCNMFRANAPTNASVSHQRMWPESRVKERFILKLKLKKMSRKKYKVVNAIAHSTEPPLRFSCWFCGRVFSDQEVWIGHGQRHLMESTKEWDKLKCEKS